MSTEPIVLSESFGGSPYYDELKDEFYVERTKTIRYLNPLTKRTFKKTIPLPRIRLVEAEGLVKKAKIRIIFMRTAKDTDTLTDIRAFFVQTVEVSVSKDRRHRWLKLLNGTIICNDLDKAGNANIIGLNEALKKRIGETPFAKVERKGKPKRITPQQVLDLFQLPDVSKTLYKEMGNASLVVVGHAMKVRKKWKLKSFLTKLR